MSVKWVHQFWNGVVAVTSEGHYFPHEVAFPTGERARINLGHPLFYHVFMPHIDHKGGKWIYWMDANDRHTLYRKRATEENTPIDDGVEVVVQTGLAIDRWTVYGKWVLFKCWNNREAEWYAVDVETRQQYNAQTLGLPFPLGKGTHFNPSSVVTMSDDEIGVYWYDQKDKVLKLSWEEIRPSGYWSGGVWTVTIAEEGKKVIFYGDCNKVEAQVLVEGRELVAADLYGEYVILKVRYEGGKSKQICEIMRREEDKWKIEEVRKVPGASAVLQGKLFYLWGGRLIIRDIL